MRIHCSRCLHSTKHTLLFERETDARDEVDDNGHAIASSGLVWTLYECGGCEQIVLRRRFWHSDMERGESEEEECYNTWFPPLVSRQIPRWHKDLADGERRIINEVYVAIHAKAQSLSAMGLRALLDMYIVRKIGDNGTFREKLDKLQKDGFLSAAQVVQLEPALDVGHAAAHRGFFPPQETLEFALDVVESLLHQDLLATRSEKVGESIPKRPR